MMTKVLLPSSSLSECFSIFQRTDQGDEAILGSFTIRTSNKNNNKGTIRARRLFQNLLFLRRATHEIAFPSILNTHTYTLSQRNKKQQT
jgi:hypothetical protein